MANYGSGSNWNGPDGGSRLPFNDGKDIPIILIILAFVFAWPLGLLLVLYNIFGREWAKKLNRNQGWQNGTYYASYREARTADNGGEPVNVRARRTEKDAQPGRPDAAPNRKPKKAGRGWPFWLTVAGGFCAVFGAVLAAEPLTWLLTLGVDSYTLSELASALVWVTSGVGLLIGGAMGRKRMRLFATLQAVVGTRDNIPVSEVAAALALSPEKTCKQLNKALDKGLFGSGAYLDMRTDTLVIRGEAPQPEKKAAAAEKPAGESQYQAILRQLREVNDAIPGEEMSAKIDRLEAITAKIFTAAEKDPEKLPKMRRFMDYYLPTALKLLNAYSQFDSQGGDGEVIRQSKQKIEQTMDVLVEGFEAQLDNLFADDALDVEADIRVLQNMMAQDGLSEDGASPFGKGV